MKKYDYIITGGGAAGLSLLMHLVESGKFRDKRILLVEKDVVKANDRTWCYWEDHEGMFEEVVFRKYSKLWFHAEDFSSLSNIAPYQYKLMRGIDFYTYCLSVISAQPNIELRYGTVSKIASDEYGTYAVVDGDEIQAAYIFNSILFERPQLTARQYYLVQHFMGWVIRTPQPVFDPGEATLMDFRMDQSAGTTFVYVMPYASNTALVEYTVFSPQVLEEQQYEAGLKKYLKEKLGVGEFILEETEKGAIPMTNYNFKRYDNCIVNIGTAGGDTKASSGYTFNFIQKQCQRIVQALDKTGKPFSSAPVLDRRFTFYDSTLLNILYNRKAEGADVFSRLFRYNDMRHVLQFLDNESSIPQELRLISVLPKLKFLKAALQQMF